MPKPQQPELRRNDLGPTSDDGTQLRAADADDVTSSGNTGPVPPENQPGHHPEQEQDKPVGPPQ